MMDCVVTDRWYFEKDGQKRVAFQNEDKYSVSDSG